MVSKVFEHPFDLAKVRLQSQVLDATARFSGPIDCLTKTWRNEGIRGLYRVRTDKRRIPQPLLRFRAIFMLFCVRVDVGAASTDCRCHG